MAVAYLLQVEEGLKYSEASMTVGKRDLRKYSIAPLVGGTLLVIFGTIFALQGLGVLGGSIMSNNPFWIYAGSVIAVTGVIIVVVGAALGRVPQKPAVSERRVE